MITASKLPVDTIAEGTDAMDMANLIFGSGVTVTGATFTGDDRAAGIYSNGDAISPESTPGDTGIILSTGDSESFTNASGQANQVNSKTLNNNGVDGNPQINAGAGGLNTFDGAILDVDFRPDASVLTMQFVFASEEYPEFVNSVFQDFVGVWVNGMQVPLEVGDGDVDPGNVNPTSNINLYIDNQNDTFNSEMDGLTISMTLTMNVNPGQVNSMRVAIADVADANFDSNLLIAANSVQTRLVALADTVSVFPNGTTTVDVTDNDINTGPDAITITQINGQDVVAGDTIMLPTGQNVTLNADGTLTVAGDGDTEDFNFTYSVFNGADTDVGFVNATAVPCFVAGTLIATPSGEVPAETLVPGDLVLTQDEGPQPLRWIGTRQVEAKGEFAPICMRANTFGQHRDLMVSPLHRILIRDTFAELLFGEDEVLVAARDLVNDRSVRRQPGGHVTYVHLLFDRHQVVFSEGLESESFLPGPQTAASFERDMVNEICALFPEIDPETGLGYSPAVRRTLKRYEADLLRAAKVA